MLQTTRGLLRDQLWPEWGRALETFSERPESLQFGSCLEERKAVSCSGLVGSSRLMLGLYCRDRWSLPVLWLTPSSESAERLTQDLRNCLRAEHLHEVVHFPEQDDTQETVIDPIRLRLLDPALPSLPGCAGLPDITLDAASFADLALPIERVFITENEVNFLAFPPVARAIVLFGAGYGWDALARAGWLHRCHVHYWGDLDTHGFAILDQLRGHFPHAASLLMDRDTLLAHRPHWDQEPEPARHDLHRLTPDEATLFDDLRFDRLQARLRLEQERVGFGWLSTQLRALPRRDR